MIPPFSLTDPLSQAAFEAGQNAGAYTLSASFAYTILGAAIAGASLILIIYTIVTPKLWEKIKEKRLKKEEELFAYVKACVHRMRNRRSTLSPQDKEELLDKVTALKEYSTIPLYLKKGPGLFIFTCYILSAILVIVWELNVSSKITNLTPWIFLVGTITFFFAGWSLIKDITELVKDKYKEK